MKSIIIIASFLVAFSLTNHLVAQEMPQMPAPVEQHNWLQKFVGNWESETELYMEPGKPPIKGKGTETVKAIGGFWILGEGTGEMMGSTMKHVITLGFDPATKRYTGTWIDSMTSHLWNYSGTLDETGNILTLESQGPCPKRPGELTKFKDVTEFKDADHRIFASFMQDTDGQWIKIVSGVSRRVN